MFLIESGNDETLKEFEEILNGISVRDSDITDLQLAGNMEEWRISIQDLMLRQALMCKELHDRRKEISQMIAFVLESNDPQNKKSANLMQIVNECQRRHKLLPHLLSHWSSKSIVNEEKVENVADVESDESDLEEDEDFNELLVSVLNEDNIETEIERDLPTIIKNMPGFKKDNELWNNLLMIFCEVIVSLSICIVHACVFIAIIEHQQHC